MIDTIQKLPQKRQFGLVFIRWALVVLLWLAQMFQFFLNCIKLFGSLVQLLLRFRGAFAEFSQTVEQNAGATDEKRSQQAYP